MTRAKIEHAFSLLQESNPTSDAELEKAMSPQERETARGRAIRVAGSDPQDRRVKRGRPALAGRRYRSAVGLAAGIAGVAAAAFFLVDGTSPVGGGGRPAYAAEAIRVAEANQRLLVTQPGWSVREADEFSTKEGQMTFGDGKHSLEVSWRPQIAYSAKLDDRDADGNSRREITVLGRPASLFQYGDSSDYTTILPPQQGTFVEVRGNLGSEESYLQVLQSLRPTDVETWLAALPESVVRPDVRVATAESMLDGIPLPPGFNRDQFQSQGFVSGRYHLGARVSGAIACAWLDRWSSARAVGDEAQANEAVRAMGTARTWPILLEMDSQGDYPEAIWEYADQMTTGHLGRGSYRMGLGCEAG